MDISSVNTIAENGKYVWHLFPMLIINIVADFGTIILIIIIVVVFVVLPIIMLYCFYRFWHNKTISASTIGERNKIRSEICKIYSIST